MVVFNTVIVKKYLKITILASFFLCIFFATPVKAADPSFSLYPSGGVITNKSKGFTVDVLVNSGGQKLTSARFVITFDPKYLQVIYAGRNNVLFAQWPDDEASIDNTNGVVMLTGFSQSGTDTLYTTGTSSDIMARITFKVLKEGKTTLDWEFSGADEDFKSVLLTEGSPPQNILKTKPASAKFTIGKEIVQTAISWNKFVFAGGIVCILFGGLMIFSRSSRFGKRRGTIVVFDKDE